MIREGHKLPPDVTDRIPALIERISKDPDIIALFAFGSLASDTLKPLSDLDFGILGSGKKIIRTLQMMQFFRAVQSDFCSLRLKVASTLATD